MSQTVAAQLRLRELILSGELQPGVRLSELSIVDRLKVSRTPVRAALARMQEEGLVEALPNGGFVVRAFSEQDVSEAIDVLGVLEGLAARLAAEKGANKTALLEMKNVLAETEPLLARQELSPDAFNAYVGLNERFHSALMEVADSPVLSHHMARSLAVPFASPNGFVMAQSERPEAHTILAIAHDQHRCVVEAIEAGEGGRAEAIMREHARLSRRNLEFALTNQNSFNNIAGAALIERKSA